MPKNILITGGAGFIGSHLTRAALDQGHRVRILDTLSPQIHGPHARFQGPSEAEFLLGDVTHRSDVEAALKGIDTLVHLAAETGTGQSMYEIDRYYHVNVQGTALLFDILANNSHSVEHAILASSRSVYGEGAYLCSRCDARCYPKARPAAQLAAHDWSPRCPTCGAEATPTATAEDDQLSPASIYAATKLAQEDMVRIACSSLDIGYSILRFQNVFGEGQSLSNPYTGILSIFSTRIRLGLPLPVFEDGQETRDFVHVEDVAGAVLRCATAPRLTNGIFNVGSGKATSIFEVAQLLSSMMAATAEPYVSHQYRVGDIRHNFADIDKLAKIVGFSPAITLKEGLQRFCQWVATQPIPDDLLEKANAELKERNLMG